MHTSIIIPVFNQLAYTKACLEAIWRNTADAGPYEVIVVDNNSSDGTGDFLKRLQQERNALRVISLESNLGFSEASNRGAQEAKDGYLVFLNNDTEVQTDWLSELLKVAARKDTGAAGSKLVYPDTQTINHAGYVYNPQLGFYPIYHNVPCEYGGVNKEREFQALLGACLLIRKDLFMQLGMFADYGLEDIDLCLKVRQAGYKVIYCPTSVVFHHGSVTIRGSAAGAIPEMNTKEFNKHWPKETLLHDDHLYFRSDGVGFEIQDGNVIELYDQVGPSFLALNEGLMRLKANDRPAARRHFERAVKLYPHNIDACLELVCLLIELGDLPRAVSLCQEMIKYQPKRYEGYFYLAELQLKLGHREEARAALEQMLNLPAVPEKARDRALEVLHLSN